ncbi:Peptidoglycan-recognition protein LA [Pseudolycoriella hygida]|uniref:Peptidoglycan-recognition protein LA n=1 Tax=Pseudolycoriella hygida TaxID=35572 RepID=A0A9Q0N184_9DIPT|nr:Peptidoglycan-recognition protein LA [Pseudolycoriella hygida]
MITHIGVQSRPCNNIYNCSIKMRTIQDSAIAEKKWDDLPANFYVSNDGYIYVGRGWNTVNEYNHLSLAICFMGDYVRYEPSPRQVEGVKYLLTYGLTRQFIDKNYKLVAHNQTQATKSPGVNVYKEVVKLPHWYPCGTDGYPKCDI